MIDFHSHILPGIDDGSKSIEESLKLLEMLSAQGVTVSVATPHFSADSETPDEFLQRRGDACQRLIAALPAESPRILCGAEVAYYNGISRMPDLNKLCIEGSKLLLLEMTMSKWTEYTVRELLEMAHRTDIKLAIAHVDRYMNYQSGNTISKLYDSGILMQFNASFFNGFFTKRRAITMLEYGNVHMIGSDCHNLTSRAPRIGDTFDTIKSKLGSDFLSQFNKFGCSLLNLS